MTVLGTVYLNGCNYQIGYDLISQSTANNTSTVKFYGVLNVTNNYISWSRGTASVRGVSTGIGTYYSKGSHTLVQTQQTITHNADGTYSATVSGSLSTTFVSGTASGKITLPTIPRASQPSINTYPNNSPDFNIGDTITIHMNRKSTAFTHKVVFKLNNYSYTIAASGVTNSVTFNTSTIENNIYAQIPNSTVANGTIEVTTYNGSTSVGTKSCAFSAHAVGVNPTFNAAYLDTNSTTVAITGNNQKIIQSKSTLQINATSLSAKKSATLSSIKAVINGTTYTATISGSSATFNIGTLNLSSNTTAKLTLTDSRGLTATKNLTIQMLAWAFPTAIITAERENNFYNPTTINVDASYSSLNNQNTIEIKMRYKKTSDSSYSAYETLQDNVSVTIQLDNNYDFNVQVVVTDKLGSRTYNLIVERGTPIVFFDKNKRAMGVNTFPEKDESLEVAGLVKAYSMATKNMFDKNNVCIGWAIYTDGRFTANANRCTMMKYIKIDNTKKYTLSTENDYTSIGSYGISIAEYDSSFAFIKRSNTGSATKLTITPTNTTEYVMLCAPQAALNELQFEEGEDRTEYAPYQEVGHENDVLRWFPIPTTLYGTNITYYNANQAPELLKVGNIVYFRGVLKTTAEISSGQQTTLLTIPEGYRLKGAIDEVHLVCQGSGVNKWVMTIGTAGYVKIQRYGTTSNIAIPSGAWLPFSVSYPSV